MNLKNFLKSLGPGLLWAGAAIGVSHLVQSTRAGALYGFELIWMILFFHLFKYPFFEFAPRYTIATGESLLHGYRRIGKWAVLLYLILTILTMFTLQSAVTVVTGGILSSIFPVFSAFVWTLIVLAVGSLLVIIGKYSVLDRFIKVIIILLALSTVVAVFFAFSNGFHPQPEFARSFDWTASDIILLIAFAGWMPTAIDISVWHSYWTLARIKDSGYTPKLKEALLDFNVGYIGTAVLAIGFLALGALVMYGTGEKFSESSAGFAGQLMNLFTSSLGAWSYPIIALAAVTTMLSTTFTCLDAYPRVMKPTTELLIPSISSEKEQNWVSWAWLGILLTGTILILAFFSEKLKLLVDLATTLSFLTAPILGFMNYRVVTAKNVPIEAQPGIALRILSWVGLIVLTGFSVYYLIVK